MAEIEGLVINPNTEVVQEHRPDGDVTYISSPVRGYGIRRSELNYQEQLQFLKEVLPMLKGSSPANLSGFSEEKIEAGKAIGMFVPSELVSRPVPYNCKLDERSEKATSGQDDHRGFYLNPSLLFSASGGLPASLGGRLTVPEEFEFKGPTAWVEDSRTRIIYPFELSDSLAERLNDLMLGKVGVEKLPRSVILPFIESGILVNRAYFDSVLEWRRNSPKLGDTFRTEGFTKILGLLNPLHLKSLSSYYWNMIEEGWVYPGDGQVYLRMQLLDDPVGRFFHRQMASWISEMFGEIHRPTFCNWGCYKPGAVLEEHVDREQAGISISYLIDYKPAVAREDAWPLVIKIAGQEHVVKLDPGECVMFDGRKNPHYRKALPEGHMSMSIFFFFANEKFDGPEVHWAKKTYLVSKRRSK